MPWAHRGLNGSWSKPSKPRINPKGDVFDAGQRASERPRSGLTYMARYAGPGTATPAATEPAKGVVARNGGCFKGGGKCLPVGEGACPLQGPFTPSMTKG